MRLGILMMLPPGPAPIYSYVRSSVLRWFEQHDIDIVLIPATLTSPAEIAAYFESIHGLYLHPDWAEHSDYTRLTRTFLTMATAANKAGDYFPVWGTCLGYETMMQFFGGLPTLERFDARHRKGSKTRLILRRIKSRLLGAATEGQLDHLRHTYMPYLDHDFGVSVTRFLGNRHLRETFRILSTCHDRAGKEYISMIEGRTLPFYGTQFHPDMHRSMDWMAAFFADEMRKSGHTDNLVAVIPPPHLRNSHCLEEMAYRVPCKRSDL